MVLGVFAVLYVTMIITLATLWTVGVNTRMFYPAFLCIVLLLACRGLNLIPQFRYATTASVTIVTATVASFASLSFIDHYEGGGRWRGYNRPDFLQMDVVEWARDHARRDGMSPIIRTESWLVAILHFATGAPFGRLPDVENLPAAVRRQAGRQIVFLISRDSPVQSYPCEAYRAAYVSAVSAHADSVSRGDGYDAWWMRASHERAAKLGELLAGVSLSDLCPSDAGP